MKFHDKFDTSHLEGTEKKIADKIVSVLFEGAKTGGCRPFYSVEEWEDRGEQYGTSSELIVVHDGGDHARYFNMDYMDYKSVEEMNEALFEIGYYAEQCTSWYSAIYKV